MSMILIISAPFFLEHYRQNRQKSKKAGNSRNIEYRDKSIKPETQENTGKYG
jgi:hypothetical protein